MLVNRSDIHIERHLMASSTLAARAGAEIIIMPVPVPSITHEALFREHFTLIARKYFLYA